VGEKKNRGGNPQPSLIPPVTNGRGTIKELLVGKRKDKKHFFFFFFFFCASKKKENFGGLCKFEGGKWEKKNNNHSRQVELLAFSLGVLACRL